MRITGHHGQRPVQILIDSGSTYNFLDVDLAIRLGCKFETINLQPVAVADGRQL